MISFNRLLILFVWLLYKQMALHWAAKHGNEDVVKLIAGTCKADVNARTVRICVKVDG